MLSFSYGAVHLVTTKSKQRARTGASRAIFASISYLSWENVSFDERKRFPRQILKIIKTEGLTKHPPPGFGGPPPKNNILFIYILISESPAFFSGGPGIFFQ